MSSSDPMGTTQLAS